MLCLLEREKKSTSLRLFSNFLIHMCVYSLQLQISLSQTLSCFAPKLPSLYRPKSLFVPGCKHVFSALKLAILTWEVYGIDSLLEPASSCQSINCHFSHFRVGFKRVSCLVFTQNALQSVPDPRPFTTNTTLSIILF